MNFPSSSLTFKVCAGERDEGERWCGTNSTQDLKLAKSLAPAWDGSLSIPGHAGSFESDV